MGQFNILVGNIVSDEILKGHDVIINPTNPAMRNGGGVCGAIFDKGGEEKLLEYNKSHFDSAMKIGEIRITPGFDLNMDIMYVQGPKQWEFDNSDEVLMLTYQNMLKAIVENGYKNALVPSLGTGIYGFDHEDVGHMVYKVIKEFTDKNNVNIDLVIYDSNSAKFYK